MSEAAVALPPPLALPDEFQPRLIHHEFGLHFVQLLNLARQNLKAEVRLRRLIGSAAADSSAFYANRPEGRGMANCLEFSDYLSGFALDGVEYSFDSLQYRHRDTEPAEPRYHIDHTGVVGVQIWKLLVNAHKSSDYQFGYLNTEILTPDWNQGAEPPTADRLSILVPPRESRWAHAVLFCASRVAHSEIESGDGKLLISLSRFLLPPPELADENQSEVPPDEAEWH